MINITKTQKEELKILNQILLKLQEKILKEAIKIDEELLKRVEDKNDLLDDYEIVVGSIFDYIELVKANFRIS
jgi:hypothetical protein